MRWERTSRTGRRRGRPAAEQGRENGFRAVQALEGAQRRGQGRARAVRRFEGRERKPRDGGHIRQFTPEALEFAKANSITLIDGPKLTRMIASVQQSGNMQPEPEPPFRRVRNAAAQMVLREASKGPHAGKKFWGCSKYPDCRGACCRMIITSAALIGKGDRPHCRALPNYGASENV